MGGSYGGYATLVGLAFTPDVFACGVDIVGPSSLVTLMENVPDYWAPFMPVMKIRVGDVETEEGKAELLERSPLSIVDQIARPLLTELATETRGVAVLCRLYHDKILCIHREVGSDRTRTLWPRTY